VDTKRISGYPEHPEPTEAAAEYDREENPRVHPWSYVWGGLVLLVILVVLAWICVKITPKAWIETQPTATTPHQTLHK